MSWLPVVLVSACLALSGCASPSDVAAPQASSGSAGSRDGEGEQGGQEDGGDQTHPDVVDVVVERAADGTFTFDVTMSSPYDSPQRYADGWRVTGPDGEVYAEKTLTHDHASEQPFTRTQVGVEVPDGVTRVVVEGRDTENGYGGATRLVELPR